MIARMASMAFFVVAIFACISRGQPVNGDLRMNQLTANPTTVASGGQVALQWSVTSMGVAGGRGQVVNWKVYRDGVEVGGDSPLTIISNGSTANFSTTVTMPTVAVATAFELVVRVFGDAAFNQNNNFDNVFVTVTPPVTPRPNLVFFTPFGWSGPITVANTQNVTVTQTVLVPDYPAFISYVVGNSGTVASGSFTMAVRVDGTLIPSLSPVPSLVAGSGTAVTNIALPANFLTPGSHTIQVRIDPTGETTESSENDNVATLPYSVPAAPANDLCSAATLAILGSNSFDTTFARTDGPTEVSCLAFGDNSVSKDVWFRYLPSGRGQLTAETCGTSFDTKLAAYSGCPGTSGTAIACDDDAANPACSVGASASRVRVNVMGGQTIMLRVGGYRNPQSGVTDFGSGSLSLSFTANPCTASDVAGPNQANGSDGALTSDDIIVYLSWFFAGDSRADIAGPNQVLGADGQYTADDIIVFLSRYFTGC